MPVESSAAVPLTTARQAGLVYVTDQSPGIRRIRHGSGFRYLDPEGKRLPAGAQLDRIKTLAIPPAWEDVWICPRTDGHLQATGRDSRGRKQYLYHPDWCVARSQTKYDRLIDFGRRLPLVRRRLQRDLRRAGFPRDKIVATVIQLLQTTLARVGNEEYAKQNHSFGLTTLRNRHVKVNGSTVHFQFQGKSGIKHVLDLHDRRIAAIIKQCQELPGQELFQYVDAQGLHSISSEDVNAYLRDVSGADFTAKDFRTWAGTVLAAVALSHLAEPASMAEAKRQISAAVEAVAQQLRNTRTVCRQCYVHPEVLNAYMDGTLHDSLRVAAAPPRCHLSTDEAAVLAFLEQRRRRGPKRRRARATCKSR